PPPQGRASAWGGPRPAGRAGRVAPPDAPPPAPGPRPDRGLAPVPNRRGPPHRARGETLLHLAIDGLFDHGLLGSIHTRSTTPAMGGVPARNVSGVCWNTGVSTPIGPAQLGPAQLARLLRLPEPTPEQAAVISAPLGPL